jgi:SM-20-related protein
MIDPTGFDAANAQLILSLMARDWAVCEKFIDIERVAALRAEAEALRAQGVFRAAGVGQGVHHRNDIRGDQVLWLDAEKMPQAQRFVNAELEGLRQAINAATYLGLYEFEGHFAAYAPGTSYTRHLDQFQQSQDRLVSMVLYLNVDWADDDGGELRLYVDGLENERVVSMSPRAGTLVCFLSARIPHEVLPARRTRLSFSGWFRRRS